MEENPNEPKKKDFLSLALAFFSRDGVIIIICLLAIVACIYTMMTVNNYQAAINQRWITQWDKYCGGASYVLPDIEYNLRGEYVENTDKYKDAEGLRPIDSEAPTPLYNWSAQN